MRRIDEHGRDESAIEECKVDQTIGKNNVVGPGDIAEPRRDVGRFDFLPPIEAHDPRQVRRLGLSHKDRHYFPASFFLSSALTIAGSNLPGCSFMNAPIARPNSFSVNLLRLRNSSSNASVSPDD